MKHMVIFICAITAAIGLSVANASKTVIIELLNTNGKPTPIGTVTYENTGYGLLLTPNLKGLPPGTHGFHVHENPSCAKNGMAAGGHLDPGKTNKHLGPYDDFGHQGDLPVLVVDADGTATLPVLAPKLRDFELDKRSIMIHAGSDNYSDKPKKMGGGGDRLACGVVK